MPRLGGPPTTPRASRGTDNNRSSNWRNHDISGEAELEFDTGNGEFEENLTAQVMPVAASISPIPRGSKRLPAGGPVPTGRAALVNGTPVARRKTGEVRKYCLSRDQ